MIRSMTGFGAADGPWGDARVAVELRTVNHRFFNPSLKLPTRLQRWEAEIRELLRQRVARGHVTLMVRIETADDRASTIDEARLARYADELRGVAGRLGLDATVDLATLLRLPDVIRAGGGEDDAADGEVAELVGVVRSASDALDEMRVAEGARLVDELRTRLARMEAAMARVAERAPARLVEQRERLRTNVRELLDGATVDEARLAQEIALLADRLDVQEEIARFAAHVAAFRATLDAPAAAGEGVGKRLGFLLQELLREANTTGSKGNDVAIVRDVIVVKEELERMREQVENIE